MEPAAVEPAKLPPPKPAPPAGPPARELLLAAIEARASELEVCRAPAGVPTRLPSRLRITPIGTVKSVEFVNVDPPPRELAECLRKGILSWRFTGLELPRETEVLVTFQLGD